MSNKYLFLFTIGPVQAFISQARKTQDLYAGSYLLSYLTNYTISQLKKEATNCEIIFPYEDLKSKPSRFTARIETDDIADLGNKLKQCVMHEFENIAAAGINAIGRGVPKSFEKQIQNHLQVTWVALPLEEEYPATYRDLESNLYAVKNVRKFEQLEESGRKCSLCGERDVLFYRGGKRAFLRGDAVSLNHQPLKYMGDGEGLCAVCLTKRYTDKYFKSDYEGDFPSTAAIALMGPLDKIEPELLNGYKSLFDGNFDDVLYYKDNLTAEYFKKYAFPIEKLNDAETQLAKIYYEKKEKNLCFYKYYAIIMFDGDNMGNWLAGNYLDDTKQLMEFHIKMTEHLSLFAEDVRSIVDKPKGRVVYSGGDDSLALLNLDHLLPVMYELRNGFPCFETLGHNIANDMTSSASCGVVIAHYKAPFSEALEWVREIEKEAKGIDAQKDAFAIAVLKHSGEISKAVMKWTYNGESTIKLVEKIVKALKDEEFSNTFIKNLRSEFGGLLDEKGRYSDHSLIEVEIRRLTDRSCMIMRKDSEDKTVFAQRKEETVKDMVSKVTNLYKNSKSEENFFSLLEIADFLSREVD